MRGTAVFAETRTPSQRELEESPHVAPSSPQEWDPHSVKFPSASLSNEDVMIKNRTISSENLSDYSDHCSNDGNHCSNDDDYNNDDDILNVSQITTELVNSPQTREPDVKSSHNHAISAIEAKSTSSASVMDNLNLKKTLDIGDFDLPMPSVFQSSNWHADVSP